MKIRAVMEGDVAVEGKDYPSRPAQSWPSSLYQSLQPTAIYDGHTGCVNSLSWHPDGRLLASGSDDLNLCVWAYSGDEGCHREPVSRTKTLHSDNIFVSSWLPDGDRIVSGGRDGLIGLWKARPDGHLTNERSYECHTGAAMRAAVDPCNSNVFLSCSMDGTVRHFDVREQHRCGHADDNGCSNVVLSASEQQIGWHAISISPIRSELLALGGVESFPLIYDRRFLSGRHTALARQALDAFKGHQMSWVSDVRGCAKREVSSVCFSPTSLTLAVSYNRGSIYTKSMKQHDNNRAETFKEETKLYEELARVARQEIPASRDLPKRLIMSANSHSSHSRLPVLCALASYELFNAAALYYALGSLRKANELIRQAVGQFNSLDGGIPEDIKTALERVPLSVNEDDVPRDDPNERRRLLLIEVLQTETYRELMSGSETDRMAFGYDASFASHLNVQTVKDVTFAGTHGEYIAAGSDAGYFFLYPAHPRRSGEYVAIDPIFIGYGDAQVTNVIQSHPSLPVLATSGIANTIKIWEPRNSGSVKFTELDQDERPYAVRSEHFARVIEQLKRLPQEPSIFCQLQ